MASNSSQPLVYDPRSATDITPYLQLSESAGSEGTKNERIQKIFRIHQTGELVASTSSRNLLIWRYNPHGACSILRAHTDWVEVLTCAYKRKPSSELSTDASDEHDQLVMLCGHYEGFDERIRSLADEEVSVGDFVLTGGELPGMVLDCVPHDRTATSWLKLLDASCREETGKCDLRGSAAVRVLRCLRPAGPAPCRLASTLSRRMSPGDRWSGPSDSSTAFTPSAYHTSRRSAWPRGSSGRPRCP